MRFTIMSCSVLIVKSIRSNSKVVCESKFLIKMLQIEALFIIITIITLRNHRISGHISLFNKANPYLVNT